MKTIKIIDLLNKIANGEEVPKKIRIQDDVFEWHNKYETKDKAVLTWDWYVEQELLNFEVEIIDEKEDKKISKVNRADILDDKKYMLSNIIYLSNKINEIIDKLNEGDK